MKNFVRNNPIAVILIVIMAAQSFLNGRFDNPLQWLISTLMLLPGIIIGLSFHEFAHAKVSNLLGDNLPKFQGRVTINPAAHIDPIGFIALLFIGFGWGKPVQIDTRNYKHPRRDELLVALAGVAMNLLLAFVFTGILKVLQTFAYAFLITTVGGIVLQMIYYIIQINIVLMVFNLIPVPPLDGFNVITQIFNLRNTQAYYFIYNNGFFILMLLILFDVTDKILAPAVFFVMRMIFLVFGLW